MTKPDLDRTIGFLLGDIGRLMRKEFDRRVRGFGITRSQWRVIVHVMRQEGLNQTQLADLMEVEPITLVRLIDKLEKAGLIERRLDPNDRRARLLYLTRKARPYIEKLKAVADEFREEMLEDLSPKERDQLIRMLMCIKAKMTNKSRDLVLEHAIHE